MSFFSVTSWMGVAGSSYSVYFTLSKLAQWRTFQQYCTSNWASVQETFKKSIENQRENQSKFEWISSFTPVFENQYNEPRDNCDDYVNDYVNHYQRWVLYHGTNLAICLLALYYIRKQNQLNSELSRAAIELSEIQREMTRQNSLLAQSITNKKHSKQKRVSNLTTLTKKTGNEESTTKNVNLDTKPNPSVTVVPSNSKNDGKEKIGNTNSSLNLSKKELEEKLKRQVENEQNFHKALVLEGAPSSSWKKQKVKCL